MSFSYINALTDVLLPDFIKSHPAQLKVQDRHRMDSTITSAKVARYVLYSGIGLSLFGLYSLSEADNFSTYLTTTTVTLLGMGTVAIGCEACHKAALYLRSTINEE